MNPVDHTTASSSVTTTTLGSTTTTVAAKSDSVLASATTTNNTGSNAAPESQRNATFELTIGFFLTCTLFLTTYANLGSRKNEDLIFRTLLLCNGLNSEALRQALHLSPKAFHKPIQALSFLGCVCSYEDHLYLIPADPNFNPDEVTPFAMEALRAQQRQGQPPTITIQQLIDVNGDKPINPLLSQVYASLQSVKCCKVDDLVKIVGNKGALRQLKILESWGLVLLRDDLVYLIPRDPLFSPELEFRRQCLSYDPNYAAGFVCTPFNGTESSAYYQEVHAAEEAKKAARRAAREAKRAAAASAANATAIDACSAAANSGKTAAATDSAPEQDAEHMPLFAGMAPEAPNEPVPEAAVQSAPASAAASTAITANPPVTSEVVTASSGAADKPAANTNAALVSLFCLLATIYPPLAAHQELFFSSINGLGRDALKALTEPQVVGSLPLSALQGVLTSTGDLPQPYSFSKLTPENLRLAEANGLTPTKLLPLIAYHKQFQPTYEQVALSLCDHSPKEAKRLACSMVKANIFKAITQKPGGKTLLHDVLSPDEYEAYCEASE